jgi:predicted RNase H-like nuclease (RuvC/YqgF family)
MTSSISSISSSSAGTASQLSQNMTYAQALNDAKTLIVQQSARIKSDAQKLKAQAEEITQLRALVEALSADVDRLREMEPRLSEALAGREHAETTVGRQRIEIEALEGAARELQRVIGDQASRLGDLSHEVEQLRGHLPTDEDAAALEAMSSLLSKARKSRQAQGPVPPQGLEREPGPVLVHDEHHRDDDRIVIPGQPTPFCQVAGRKAA